MSKKKKLGKAAAALGAAYLATKMGSDASSDSLENVTAAKDAQKMGFQDNPRKYSSTKPFAEPGLSARQKQVNKNRKFFGMDEKTYFKSGGMVVTKGQGKVMKSKKTILLT